MTRITLNIFDVTPQKALLSHFRAVALATVLSLVVTPLAAQDWQKGLDAYNAGDYSAAISEWQPLVDQGHGEAALKLGGMYMRGEGVLQDYAERLRLYQLAAKQLVVAQFFLGVIYQDGDGVPQDNVLAHMWYNIASANGSSSGGLRDQLAEGMTQADISTAQAMARECMGSGYQNCGY
jgi:TPR repeat protein